MGINLGALISPFACGWVGEKVGWRLGFGLAGVGMIAGLIQYTLGGKYLGVAGLPPRNSRQPGGGSPAEAPRGPWRGRRAGGFGDTRSAGRNRRHRVHGRADFRRAGGACDPLGSGFFLAAAGRGWSVEERKRSAAILVLFLSSAVFWFAFEQAGSSLNLFAEGSVDRWVHGYQFPASWFQLVQPFFIITLAPVFAWLWVRLGKREPSSPAKFAFGLFFVSAGFILLVPVAGGHAVSPLWLIGTYFLHTLGE